jgi:AcrR family transcriptional regulator
MPELYYDFCNLSILGGYKWGRPFSFRTAPFFTIEANEHMNRREKQKAETFLDIMRAAEALFMRQGYEKTSMQEIADHAGVTKGALYHHFDSKDALLERMCRDHHSVIMDAARPIACDASLSCFERIRNLIALSRGMGMSSVTFVSEYIKLRGGESSVVLKERLCAYERTFYAELIGPLLREAKSKGECDFASSPRMLALFIHCLDRSVNEEINCVFASHSRSEAEKSIVDIMKSYVYVISRMLGLKPDDVSSLIGLQETMHFYGEVLRKRNEQQ